MTIASIRSPLQISWELLPDDYPLPDDPVDNIDQPLLAEALRESLDLAHQLPLSCSKPVEKSNNK